MEFEKTIELNVEDIYYYNMTIGTNSFRSIFILFFAAFGVFLGCAGYILSWSLLIFIIMTFFLFFSLFTYLYYKAKKTFTMCRLTRMPKQIRLNDIGAHIRSEIETTNIPWQDFDKAIETKRAFYLHFQMFYDYIIPKRLLEPNDIFIIRSMIIKKSPDKETSLGDEY